MSVFSLDSIRDAAEAKYGSTDIQVDENTLVRLRNPLRLPKAERDALVGIQDALKADDVDQVAVFGDAIALVADDKAAAARLLSAVGDDLAVLAQIFETYSEGTSVGEASASVD